MPGKEYNRRDRLPAGVGELRRAVEAGLLNADRCVELGQIAVGIAPGRCCAESITICDLTGTGAQDTAIANFAVGRVKARGFGTTIRA